MMAFIEEIKRRLDDPDEETRLQAVLEFSVIPQEEIAPILLNALGDSSWRVRRSAIEAIFDLPEPETVIPTILDGLRSEDNAGLRNSSIEVLTRMGKTTLPCLLKALEDKDHGFRKFVVDILGDIGGEEVVSTLIEAMKDEDENVRLSAIEGLGKVGDDRAVNVLLEIVEIGDIPLKFTALESLSRIGRPIPMEGVYKAAQVPLLRKAAYDVMGKVGGVEAIPYLIEGLKETSSSSLGAVLVALRRLAGRVGEDVIRESPARGLDASAVERITHMLEGSDAEVKRGAVSLLGLIGKVESIPALLRVGASEEFMEDVSRAIIRFGKNATDPLIQAYYTEEGGVRSFICYLLGEIGDMKAEGFLIEALRDGYGHVRSQTAIALGKLGSRKAVGPIIQLLGDEYEDVKKGAMEALIFLGRKHGDTVVGAVLPLLHSKSPSTREKAVAVLGRIGGKEARGAVGPLLRDSHPSVRKAVIAAVKRDIDYLQDIVLALADEDEEVRLTATKVLGDMEAKEATAPLLSALKDNNIWVRCAAIEGLSKLGGDRAMAAIKEAILEEKDGVLVMAGLEALGRIARDRVDIIPLIVQALSHPDAEVVKTAVEVLGRTGKGAIVDKLLPLLEHNDWVVRLAVVSVLHEVGGSQVRDLLKAHLEREEDELVRRKISELVD
ncbi:MAG: HEAT repeat domain-containing protein [Deltaproteobacteria bacterium]|nr:HEAT repeat domain-containing protein [Deltaproteobacteria bacterium]